MIMPAGRPLLLPANPKFIALSFALAMLLQMLLGLLGWYWLPDVLAIVVVFWTVHQPRRVGLVLAFVMGLALDVHESALLGQNALSYVVLSGLATVAQRRVLWFPLREQALQILPLFLVAAVVEWLTRLVAHDVLPAWSQLPAPFFKRPCGLWWGLCCWHRSGARSIAMTSGRFEHVFEPVITGGIARYPRRDPAFSKPGGVGAVGGPVLLCAAGQPIGLFASGAP